MSNSNEWEALIDRHLEGDLDEAEKERLAELLDSNPAARKELVEQAQWETRLIESLREQQASPDAPIDNDAPSPQAHTRLLRPMLWGVAALIPVVLIAILYFGNRSREPQAPRGDRKIVTIAGLSGPVIWTGDGGRIVRELRLGTELSAGTIDGLSPDSWLELEFRDGSSVTISGYSVLTFSHREQKELHLKSGSLSAEMAPQSERRPLLIHTQSAILEVLEAQFTVEASLASTELDVREGMVRVKRLSDSKTVEVRAGHRAIAAANRNLSPMKAPKSIHSWKSQLDLGPHRMYGEWKPRANGNPAKLKAMPYTTERGKTIYTTSFRVSSCDNPPVVLRPGSTIRARGMLKTAHRVYFGLTVRQANGSFAGRFQTIRPAKDFRSGEPFEVFLSPGDYKLDPSLAAMKDRLPETPFHLVIESLWSHTLHDPVGLSITEVELIGPGQGVSDKQSLSNNRFDLSGAVSQEKP